MTDDTENTAAPGASGGMAAPAAARPAAPERKHRRMPRQSASRPPEGAKPLNPRMPLGFGPSVVPVSSAARDWGVSARRMRALLAEGRLAGRQLDNGYWEVFYPYRVIFGTRGPQLRRQRNLPEAAPRRERNSEWW